MPPRVHQTATARHSRRVPRFLAFLATEFEDERHELLQRRTVRAHAPCCVVWGHPRSPGAPPQERHAALSRGATLDFLPETRWVRESEWKVAPIPADLQDRRVEITGPPDRKMVINALNSGACGGGRAARAR